MPIKIGDTVTIFRFHKNETGKLLKLIKKQENSNK
jgi:hypothetical protein